MNDVKPQLEVSNLHTAYGSIPVHRGISLQLLPGELVCVLGANGAGKSTLVKAVLGLLRPKTGMIAFQGERIDRRPTHEIVRRGVSWVPEGRRVFPVMSVLENLQMGGFRQQDRGELTATLEEVLDLFPQLKARLKQEAVCLSGGEQQMLAVGRALMSRPKLLCMDEPSMGLGPIVIETLYRSILEINESGVSILLVEQNAQVALEVAHRGYVLVAGEFVLEGPAETLIDNDSVKEAYLGGSLEITEEAVS